MVAFVETRQNPNDNEVLLTGYAGTGKTFVVQQLLKHLKETGQKQKIVFTAPTNSAVKVLKDMAKSQGLEVDCKTTYSLLGLKEQTDKLTGQKSYARDKKEVAQHLKYNIMVVDEASMLNKALREEVLKASQQGVKIIYMGDRAQLPPVGESESLVFQIENRADLTEVMRYGGDLGKVAESIRNNLETDKLEPSAQQLMVL